MDSNELSSLYNKYIDEDNYEKALEYLLQAQSIKPESSWIVTTISICYYELREYETALNFAKKAYSMHRMDPLVRWNYAVALYGMNLYKEAIRILKMLNNRGVYNIGHIDCTEGTRWAMSLYNDSFHLIALSYFYLKDYKKSILFNNKHLELRKKGIRSIYKKRTVLKELQQAENHIEMTKIWTGLIHIAPMTGCIDLKKNERAYTTIVLYADDKLDFIFKVTQFLNGLNFEVLNLEYIKTVASYKKEIQFSNELEKSLKLVIKEKTPKITKLRTYIKGT